MSATANQLVSHSVEPTRTSIYSLWNHPRPGSDIENIIGYVTQLRPADMLGVRWCPILPLSPTRPFSCMSSLLVLHCLTPEAIARKHKEILIAVIAELAEIVTGLDDILAKTVLNGRLSVFATVILRISSSTRNPIHWLGRGDQIGYLDCFVISLHSTANTSMMTLFLFARY